MSDLKIEMDVSSVKTGTQTVNKAFAAMETASKSLESSLDKMKVTMKDMGLKSSKSLIDLNKALDSTAKEALKAEKAQTKLDKASKLKQVALGTAMLKDMVTEQKRLVAIAKNVTAEQNKLDKASRLKQMALGSAMVKDMVTAENNLIKSAKASATAQAKLNRSFESNKIKMAKKEIAAYSMAANLAAKKERDMAKALSGTNWGKFKTSISGATSGLLGFAAAATAAYAIVELGQAVFKSGQESLVAANAYKAITGSVAGANAEFMFLSKTAEDLGQNFFTLRTGYQGFLAAAQSSKIPMEEVRNIFSSITNATSVMGLSAQKTSLVFLALEQMMSKGKVSMEEIRRQMGDSLPGAFQIGARAMGMTVEAFDKAVSAGEVYSDDFLPKFRRAMDEAFQGTIAESVKTVNKLAEAWELLKINMAEGGFMNKAVMSLKEITAVINDPATIRNMSAWANLGGTLTLWAAISFNKLGNGIANLSDKFASLGIASVEGFDVLLLKQDELALKIKELDGGVLTGAESWKLYTAEMALLQSHVEENVEELKKLSKAEDSVYKKVMITKIEAETTALENQIAVLQETTNQYQALGKAKSNASGTVLPTDTQSALALSRAEEKYSAQIEADVLKRIAKTDAAKLASKKAELASYIAYGGKNIAVVKQFNAEIITIEEKQAKAILKIKTDADKKRALARKPIDAIITRINKDQLASEIALQKQATEEFEKYEADKLSAVESFQEDFESATMNQFDAAKASLDREYAYYSEFVDDKTKLNKWYAASKAKIDYDQGEDSRKALKKVLDEEKKLRDNMLKEIQKETADVFKDILSGELSNFEDFTDQMLSLFLDMIAEMAAAAVVNILFNGSTSGVGGIASSLLGGSSSASGGVMDTIGSTLSNKILSPITDTITDTFGSMFGSSSLGGSMGPTAGMAGGNPGLVGVSASSASGFGGLGAMGTAGFLTVMAGLTAHWVSQLNDAQPTVSFRATENAGAGIAGSNVGTQTGDGNTFLKDWAKGSKSSNFDYTIGVKDTDQDPEIQAATFEYFDTLFFGIEDSIGVSMNEVLNKHQFFIDRANLESGQTIADTASELFDEILGTLLIDMLPNAGTIEETLSKHTGNLAGVMRSIGGGDGDPMPVGTAALYEDITLTTSKMAEIFNREFFDAIMPEGGTEWDSFIAFGEVVKNSTNFLEDFTWQTERYGESTLTAYQNLQFISEIMNGIDEGVEFVTQLSLDTGLSTLELEWQALLQVLDDTHATLINITEAERGRNIDLGAELTGLSATSIKSTILSGGDISSQISEAANSRLTNVLVNDLMDNFITGFIEEVGRIKVDEGIDAANAYAEAFDFTDINKQIKEFQTNTLGLEEAISDIADTSSDAAFDLDDAIDGLKDLKENLSSLKSQLSDVYSSIGDQRAQIGLTSMEASLYAIQQEYKANITEINELETAINETTSEIGTMSNMIESNLTSIIDFLKYSNEVTDTSGSGGSGGFDTIGRVAGAIDQFFSNFTGGGTGISDIVDGFFPTTNNTTPGGTTRVVTPGYEGNFSNLSDGQWTIATSNSFEDRYSEIENEVIDNYLDILHRLPGQAGLDFWSTSGFTGEELIKEIENSYGANLLANNGEDIHGELINDESFGSAVISFTNAVGDWVLNSGETGSFSELSDDVQDRFQTIMDRWDVAPVTEFIPTQVALPTPPTITEDPVGLADDQMAVILDGFNTGLVEEFYQLTTSDFDKKIDAISASTEDRFKDLNTLVEYGLIVAESPEFDTAEKLIMDIKDLQIQALEDIRDAAIKTQSDSLQIRLLTLQGNTDAVTALKRSVEKQSTLDEFGADSGFIELLEQIYALEDAASDAADNLERFTEAESVRDSAKDAYLTGLYLEVEILETTLNDAKSVYLGLLEEELSVQQDLASSLEGAIEQIKDYRLSLFTGDTSPLSSGTQQGILAGRRDSLTGQVLSGDVDSIDDLITTSQDYLEVSKATSKTAIEYARDVAKTNVIMARVEKASTDQLTEAERQISLTQDIIDEVNGVNDQITNLDEARGAYETAKAAFDDNWYNIEIEKLEDIKLGIYDLKAAYEESKAAVQVAQYTATTSNGVKTTVDNSTGNSISQPIIDPNARIKGGGTFDWKAAAGLTGYANGGITTGPASGHMELLHGTEAVIPLSGGSIPVDLDYSALVNEVRILTGVVAKLQQQNYDLGMASIRHNSDTAKTLKRWDGDGLPPEREVA